MELDNKGLGRLRRVASARDVWTSESGDFTPWLADNLDVLADELGLPLTFTAQEVSVGEFRLDIQAETAEGRVVVIENQLEKTDHAHLGQLLLYASGLEATAVVWVAAAFRDDHRRTLDWLNERTDSGVDFFGVEVGVVQISDDGPRAPVFEVVARPNNWQKGVKDAGHRTLAGGGGGGPTPLNAKRQDFFAEVLAEVVAQRPTIRLPARAKGHWLSFASGPWGAWDISAAAEGRLRVGAYIDSGNEQRNKDLFDELFGELTIWEHKVGVPLSWERLDDRRACRVAAYADHFDVDDAPRRGSLHTWAVKTVVALHDAMNQHLRLRARQLRDAALAQSVESTGSSTEATNTGSRLPALTDTTTGPTSATASAAPDRLSNTTSAAGLAQHCIQPTFEVGHGGTSHP